MSVKKKVYRDIIGLVQHRSLSAGDISSHYEELSPEEQSDVDERFSAAWLAFEEVLEHAIRQEEK